MIGTWRHHEWSFFLGRCFFFLLFSAWERSCFQHWTRSYGCACNEFGRCLCLAGFFGGQHLERIGGWRCVGSTTTTAMSNEGQGTLVSQREKSFQSAPTALPIFGWTIRDRSYTSKASFHHLSSNVLFSLPYLFPGIVTNPPYSSSDVPA